MLSPDFYGIYVDELISILTSANVGCYILERFAAALIYAAHMNNLTVGFRIGLLLVGANIKIRMMVLIVLYVLLG